MFKALNLIFHRIVIIILLMLIQILLIAGMVWRFNRYFVYFYAVCMVIGAVILLYIINSSDNPEYKLAWIIPLLLVPIFGGMLYLLFGFNRIKKKDREKNEIIRKKQAAAMEGMSAFSSIESESLHAANQSRYILNSCTIVPFKDSFTEYLPLGETVFSRMKEELEKAERYIFMEYFIIEEGIMWDSILEILVRKAAQGLDVRVIYDDVGSLFTLPYRYDKKLKKLGISCAIFNPFTPVLSSRFNNRDHRKITVIDGHTAFTGGINLADEYINAVNKYGHWKDTGIIVKGKAAWGFTLMFLGIWEYVREENRDYSYYYPPSFPAFPEESVSGYVHPYSDVPLDNAAVAENIYMNIIYKAEKYVYITSPYLIIDNGMVSALTAAAKSGVDVRIITPRHGDKWYVHSVTRSYYEVLLENGVRIYEYTPGFIHGKSFVADDAYGVVGSVNLDFRSFYLHFECGAWLYNTQSIGQIRDDFFLTLEKCQEITLEEYRSIRYIRKFGRAVLRVFAPLM
ncbi:cardiolipin synthase [Treponema sp. OttesenSCG-928-L16]|nr:cardiolipin synthase [Treponema sp. OttesenSCG-928-L16]